MENDGSRSVGSVMATCVPTLTEAETVAFCKLCSWAYEVWATHRAFQDDERVGSQPGRKHAYFLNRLSAITQEYCLQQLVKLHDRPAQHGRDNLTISYVIERGDWDTTTLAELQRLRHSLDELVEHIRPARNRILAHNDRDTIIGGESLGGFRVGQDDAYFVTLQRFVDLVHDRVVGGPYPFDDFAAVDADAFIEAVLGTANDDDGATLD